MMHWDITNRLGFNIDTCEDEFIGFELNMGYSPMTGNFQISFQLGILLICFTYWLGQE